MHHIHAYLRRRLKPLELRRRSLSIWFAHDLDLAYIAVPKVASSSIHNLIRDRAIEQAFPDSPAKDPRTLRRIEKRVKLSTTPARLAPLRQRYFFFSFVRNPISRLYSCYRDKIVKAASRRPRSSLARYDLNFGITFDDFVQRVAQIPDNQSDQHFRSQHTFLTHNDQLLVDHLGRFESFDHDWAPINQRFNLPHPSRNHRVSGPPTPLTNLPISRTILESAIHRYQRDITLFNYEQPLQALLDHLTAR